MLNPGKFLKLIVHYQNIPSIFQPVYRVDPRCRYLPGNHQCFNFVEDAMLLWDNPSIGLNLTLYFHRGEEIAFNAIPVFRTAINYNSSRIKKHNHISFDWLDFTFIFPFRRETYYPNIPRTFAMIITIIMIII